LADHTSATFRWRALRRQHSRLVRFRSYSLSGSTLLELEPRFVDDIFAVRSDPEVQLYNSVPHQTRDYTFDSSPNSARSTCVKAKSSGHLRCAPHAGRRLGERLRWDRYYPRASIGYELARDQWGKGLARKALHEVLRFAFDKMMFNRIEIWTAAENQRSVRLA